MGKVKDRGWMCIHKPGRNGGTRYAVQVSCDRHAKKGLEDPMNCTLCGAQDGCKLCRSRGKGKGRTFLNCCHCERGICGVCDDRQRAKDSGLGMASCDECDSQIMCE